MGDFQTFTYQDKVHEDLILFKHQLEALNGDLSNYTQVIAKDEPWRNAVIDWMMDESNVVLARHAFYVLRSYLLIGEPKEMPHLVAYIQTFDQLSCQKKYYLSSLLLLLDESYQMDEHIKQWMFSLTVAELTGLIQTLKMSPLSYSRLLMHFLSHVTVFSKHVDPIYISMLLLLDSLEYSSMWCRELLGKLSVSTHRKTRLKASQLLNEFSQSDENEM